MKRTILSFIIRIIYNCFSFINKTSSSSGVIYKTRQYIYSKWLSFRFNCKNCRFDFPLNFRCGSQYFSIGEDCSFGRFAVLTAWDTYDNRKYNPTVTIGDNCRFGDFLHLTCINKINIGKNVLTGRWVTITDNSHGDTHYYSLQIPPIDRQLVSPGEVNIGNNVWIGDKVTVLPGVTIGEGCVIGANSVVAKDIPPHSIAYGGPIIIRTKTKESCE